MEKSKINGVVKKTGVLLIVLGIIGVLWFSSNGCGIGYYAKGNVNSNHKVLQIQKSK